MEVRTRSSSSQRVSGWVDKEEVYKQPSEKGIAAEDSTKCYLGSGPTIRQRIRRETWEMARVFTNLLQGRGSKVTYLLIPAMISLFWVLICLFTTRQPSMTLEDRLAQKHYRVSMHKKSTYRYIAMELSLYVATLMYNYTIFYLRRNILMTIFTRRVIYQCLMSIRMKTYFYQKARVFKWSLLCHF